MAVQRILSWQINSINQERQEVLRSIDGAPSTVIATLSATDTEYIDTEDYPMTTGVTYQVASVATINGVEVKQVSTPVEEIVPTPTFTPFTAVIGGEYFALRTMKGATIVKLDGVELAPDEPYEDEPEDEVYDWYSSMTTVPGSIVTVSPKDSVSPLASIKIGGGISEVTEWCSLGHVASPGGTKSPVIFGQDIVSVPDYLPAEITNLTEMFYGATLFNDPNIVNWDLSNVTTLQSMFIITRAFNQPIGNWNVSKVTDLSKMFYDSPVFNQDLSGWDVSNVTDMNQMFYKAVAFNQPLNTWNVGKVTDMGSMFAASGYDQPLDQWVFPELRDMSGMFNSAAFNQPIGNWDVSNVQYMSYLFAYTAKFNQPLPNWNLGKVWEGGMSGMFTENTIFNQDLSGWCVSLNRFEPNGWNTNGIISPENYPVWGTCPLG